MSENPSRRDVLIGAASVAVGAALPISAVAVNAREALFDGLLKQQLPMAPDPAPPMLWPQDTQLQRAATTVRTMIEFIVKLEGKAAESVTVEDVHFRTQYFGMTLEETAEAFDECLLAVERYAYHPWPPRGRARIVRGSRGEYALVDVAGPKEQEEEWRRLRDG
jgi:hypothetical protein